MSFTAQQRYVFAARHQDVASIIEALLLDLLMIVFTLLALGLSRAGKSSRTERALILACAAASAYMNVSAADTASPRSVVAYAVAPDRARRGGRPGRRGDPPPRPGRRGGLGVDGHGPRPAGRQPPGRSSRAVLAALRPGPAVDRYGPAPDGARRGAAARSPGAGGAEAIDPPPTKKAALLALYRVHPDYGVKASASKVAAELAPQAGLTAGTARRVPVRRARGEGVMTDTVLAAIALVLVARPDRAPDVVLR